MSSGNVYVIAIAGRAHHLKYNLTRQGRTVSYFHVTSTFAVSWRSYNLAGKGGIEVILMQRRRFGIS